MLPLSIRKDIFKMQLKLNRAEEGEKIKIFGKDVSIIGTYESEDKQTKIPLLKSMSDFEWQWVCFTDRLFRPRKYDTSENVPQVIEKLKKWFISNAPADIKADIGRELEELITFINELEEDMKPLAEIALKEQMKARLS